MAALDYRDKIRTAYSCEFAVPNDLDELTQYPNVAFEPPNPQHDEVYWTRFNIEEADRRQITLNNANNAKLTRVIGAMVIQLFCTLDSGTRNILDLKNTLIPLFQRKTIDGVVFRTPIARVLGRSGDWFQVTVSCPFQYDEFT